MQLSDNAFVLERMLIASLFPLVLVCTAAAGPWEDGVAAYKREDFAAALELWRPLAEEGHPSAQNNLGVIYEKGLGLAADPEMAAEWYRKAAAQGHPGAKENLADLLATETTSSKTSDRPMPPDASMGTIAPEEWRSVARPSDIARFDRMQTARAAALLVAKNHRSFAEIRSAIEAPTHHIPLQELAGQWRCRSIQIVQGDHEYLTGVFVYDYFSCEITGYAIRKATGSQRLSGRLYEAKEGLVFLGASDNGDEIPIQYGVDSERDEIGLLRSLGPDHLTLEIPPRRARYEIIEFLRDNRKSVKRDPHQRQTIAPR